MGIWVVSSVNNASKDIFVCANVMIHLSLDIRESTKELINNVLIKVS